MQLFLSGLPQALFWGFYVTVMIILQTLILRVSGGAVKARSARITGLGCVSAFYAPLPVSLLFGYYGIGLLPSWAYYLGILLSTLGFGLWIWGRMTLGRYWSPEVVIYRSHNIIQRGPYRFMRHPTYTGDLLVLLGIGLAAQSWAATLIIALLGAIGFGYRIKAEEKALIGEFGEEYLNYSKKVKRLIPFVL